MTDAPTGARSDTVASLLAEIADVGRDPVRGGYSRPVSSRAELDLRTWFASHAARRGLDVSTDRNGVMWAWHAPDGVYSDAVVTGSHLDSVPGGGAFDGPLGVASALVAYDQLRERSVSGRPFAITVFPEEEGSRFGVACLGSRLMTGAITPERALSLTDDQGNTFADMVRGAGGVPERIGSDLQALRQMSAFVELHVEQGRGLVDLDSPVALASSILGHGRWRVSISGEGNHAGATQMVDRRDPMVAAGELLVRVQELARPIPDARATIGRLIPVPGGTNVIASRVDLWLDVRHPQDTVTVALVEQIRAASSAAAAHQGCIAEMTEESFSGTVDFDARLRGELRTILPSAPVLATGAGHDAGVLKDHVQTAMLFVRNPTGVSHAPQEFAEDSDIEAGADALTDCLDHLITRPSERPHPRVNVASGGETDV